MKEQLRDGVTDSFWRESFMVSDWYRARECMSVEELYQAFKARMAREAAEQSEGDKESGK